MNLIASTEHVGDDEVFVIKFLERRLDASVAEEFKAKVIPLVKGGPDRVVFDVSDIEFMDSSGLSAIISVLKQLGTDGHITICSAQSQVLNMLKLTRMDRVFHICATMEDALAFTTG